MLVDDIRAYSAGNGPAGGFLEGNLHRWEVGSLQTLKNQSVELRHNWHDEIDEIRRRREQFHQSTARTVVELRPSAAQYQGMDFAQLWDAPAVYDHTIIGSKVQSLDTDHNYPEMLEAVKTRGFEGLLEVPSVRMLTGLTLSTTWEHLYRPRQARPREL
jgi:hypothetical protein